MSPFLPLFFPNSTGPAPFRHGIGSAGVLWNAVSARYAEFGRAPAGRRFRDGNCRSGRCAGVETGWAGPGTAGGRRTIVPGRGWRARSVSGIDGAAGTRGVGRTLRSNEGQAIAQDRGAGLVGVAAGTGTFFAS